MKQQVKRYVCVILIATEGDKRKRQERSIPMSLEGATNLMRDYKLDRIDAWTEEANADDLAPERAKKQAAAQRRVAKKNAPKLFDECWFAQRAK